MADRKSEFCKECPIFRTCHPNLRPVKLERKGMAMVDTKLVYNECDTNLDCRHYTCNLNGRDELDGKFRSIRSGRTRTSPHQTIGYDGESNIVQGTPFRTKDKPTKDSRIVDTEGDVYSKQDGVYYPTGQKANASRFGRNK